MIFDNTAFPTRSWYPPALNQAIDFLRRDDLAQLECKRHDIADGIYAMIRTVETQEREQKLPEVHEEYIDIHFVVSGREKCYYYPHVGTNTVEAPMKDDVAFYMNREDFHESVCVLQPGDFAVFFPDDVHVPACAVEGPETVKKVIMKVAVCKLI